MEEQRGHTKSGSAHGSGGPRGRAEDPGNSRERGGAVRGQQDAPRDLTSRQDRQDRGAPGGGRGPVGQPRVRPSQKNPRNPKATLFIGDLPIGTTDEELEDAFEPYGKLASTRVMPNKCFGFVEFKDEAVAQSLLKQEDLNVTIQDRVVRVAPSNGPLPEWKVRPLTPYCYCHVCRRQLYHLLSTEIPGYNALF